tara:strand:+ start:10237 stop:11067 length:831 start_codon:yes stop_codon:yes gene_type:complete
MDNKKFQKKFQKKRTTTPKYFYCQCGRKYKFRSGLSKHKKKCTFINNELENNYMNDESICSENLEKEDGDDLKDIFKQFMKIQTEFNKKISEEITKPQQNIYNDCHNNKMTINVFLNQECKNAMNLTDFVDNLKISLEDLKYSSTNGFVDGVTNIFTKKLKDMDPTERPIHCSDKKRLQFYVKDDNKWHKDEDGKKMDQTITTIKLKQTTKIGEWEKLHPNYRDDPMLLNEWQNMLAGITENTSGNVLKQKLALKKKIASYIELKDAMTKENEDKE